MTMRQQQQQVTVTVAKGFDLVGVRSAHSMTLAVLWKKSRIAYSKLARIEHGEEVELDADEARRLAVCLKVDVKQFERPRAALRVDRDVTKEQRGVGRRTVDEYRQERIARVIESHCHG